MRKFLNDPDNFVNEMVEGILSAHGKELRAVSSDKRSIVCANAGKKGKVGLATGGGSGHLPLFLGYVGDGMLDGCCVGNVFASPGAQQMLEVIRAIDGGSGVLLIYCNYGGDCMNFSMAAEVAELENIRVDSIIVADDIASAPKGKEDRRRGVAGVFFAYKIAGSAATVLPLEEVKRITEKALAGTRSIGVALGPCIIPSVGKPNFTVDEGTMEIGMGIHGEPGIERSGLKNADEVAEIMVNSLIEDLPYEKGDEIAVLVNGLGSTPLEELYIVYRKVSALLKEKGISVYRVYVGEYSTSMEMAGMSLTFMKLDEELKVHLDAPVKTPFFEQR